MKKPESQFVRIVHTETGVILKTGWMPASAKTLLGPTWGRSSGGIFRSEIIGADADDVIVALSRFARAAMADLSPLAPRKRKA
jgi:hypothetical protein